MLEARVCLSRSTVGRLRTTLPQAFDWAISRRAAEWNPARAAMLPVSTKYSREGRTLTREEAPAPIALAERPEHRLGVWVGSGRYSVMRWPPSSMTWRPDLGRSSWPRPRRRADP